MKAETRLRAALERARFALEEIADEVYLAATDYQEHPVDERYVDALRKIRKAEKDARKVLNAVAEAKP